MINKGCNINPRARFLPSVKIKSLDKICKSNQKDNLRFFIKPKLKISDHDSQIPELISGYYQRFKNNLNKCSSISVSINFKQISQEQLEAKVAQNSKKLKSKTSNKKNRINSQSSYHINPSYYSIDCKQKIKISSQAIFYRLKFIEQQRNKNLQINQIIKKQQKNNLQCQEKVYNNQSYKSILGENIQYYPKKLKLMSMNKFKNQRIKNWNKSQFSTICSLNISKKCRTKFKNNEQTIQQHQQHQQHQITKRITPWKNQQENTSQSLQILQNSIQNTDNF